MAPLRNEKQTKRSQQVGNRAVIKRGFGADQEAIEINKCYKAISKSLELQQTQ